MGVMKQSSAPETSHSGELPDDIIHSMRLPAFKLAHMTLTGVAPRLC